MGGCNFGREEALFWFCLDRKRAQRHTAGVGKLRRRRPARSPEPDKIRPKQAGELLVNEPEMQLFYWLSHTGCGSRNLFERATDSLLEDSEGWPDQRRRKFARTLLDRATRLGHLTRTASNWRMRSPSLTLRSGNNGAFWRGGLSPEIKRRLSLTAAEMGGSLKIETENWMPPCISVDIERSGLSRLCAEIGVREEEDAAETAASSLPDLKDALVAWPKAQLPTGMALEMFDCNLMRWEPYQAGEVETPKFALRYTDRYRVKTHYVGSGRSIYIAPSECQAVYVSASDHPLCSYTSSSGEFKTRFPLSPKFALPLCLCFGCLPERLIDGTEVYKNVPPAIGRLLIQKLGQVSTRTNIFWL